MVGNELLACTVVMERKPTVIIISSAQMSCGPENICIKICQAEGQTALHCVELLRAKYVTTLLIVVYRRCCTNAATSCVLYSVCCDNSGTSFFYSACSENSPCSCVHWVP